MKALLLAASALAACIGAPALAQDVVITGGKVVIGDGSPPIEGGTVVIRAGRIVSAGRGGATATSGATVIDASGKWVTPGIVAGFSRVGLVEVDAVDETEDSNAGRSPFSAAVDVAPALNPAGAPVAVNRAAGITRALVFPGSTGGLFNGQGAIVDLGADNAMLTKGQAFQFVEFGEAGARRAGGSRAATFTMFRAMLAEARDYARNPAGYDGRSKDSLLLRADAEALARVMTGKQRLMVEVNRASDILQVIALKQEFPQLSLTLVGVNEGWRVAREIAAAGVPVIANALNDLPSSFERLAATQSNVGRMRAAGVNVAIGQVNDEETHRLNYTTQYAGNLVAINAMPGQTGLSWDQAFRAISAAPAEAAGMGGQLGVLRAGALGDAVVWDGDPLELSSRVEAVVIDGVKQPLETRQKRLRDRYLTPTPTTLPKAYDR